MSCGCEKKPAATDATPRLLHVDGLDDPSADATPRMGSIDLSTPVFEPDPDAYQAFSTDDADAGGIVVTAPAPSLATALLALAKRWT